nr:MULTISPECIES: sialidase family protein [Methylotenera]
MQHPAPGLSATDVAFDTKGNLWRVSVKDGFLLVDKSADLGKTFSAPAKVNPIAQKIGASNEARPDIALDADNHIYLTWTQNLTTHFAGYIWFARSIDAGKSFEKPYIVHQDRAEITHAFNALNVSPNGKITVTWIDKRDAVNAKKDGKKYDGAAIYYAVSNNHGESFAAEKKLADSSCECCRIVTANKPDGTMAVLWRHVFESSERDHMIAEIPQENAKPQLHRATFGHWQIDGCPHHGGALAAGGAGKDWWGYHIAYFDGKDASANDKAGDKSGPGLYYSRMDGVAWASSPAKKFGNNKNQAGRPAILSISNKTGDEHVWLVWHEIEAKNNKIIGMFSEDGGRSWSDTKELASTADKADYPQLLQYHQQVYLAWNTQKEGFKLIPLKS